MNLQTVPETLSRWYAEGQLRQIGDLALDLNTGIDPQRNFSVINLDSSTRLVRFDQPSSQGSTSFDITVAMGEFDSMPPEVVARRLSYTDRSQDVGEAFYPPQPSAAKLGFRAIKCALKEVKKLQTAPRPSQGKESSSNF